MFENNFQIDILLNFTNHEKRSILKIKQDKKSKQSLQLFKKHVQFVPNLTKIIPNTKKMILKRNN